MKRITTLFKQILFLFCAVILLFLLIFFVPRMLSEHYVSDMSASIVGSSTATSAQVILPSYVETPNEVKGIYMTSWTASQANLRDPLVKLIEDTELNSLVIDIKDYTGKIVFPVENQKLKAYGSEGVRISDSREFIESLHKKGIYVIGRIAVFQDAYFVKYRPDLAVKNKTGTETWKDRKGISWIDVGSREYWDYIVLLSEEARKIGFDEINFDYIRFPSDGDMHDISYPWSSTTPKALVLKDFFRYLHDNLEKPFSAVNGAGVRGKISADLFGMVTTATDDMGIGQILENTLPYFDYIDPMVYPSHYPATFQGFKVPEAHPYEVVHFAMQSGVKKAEKFEMMASTTNPVLEDQLHYKDRLRPWLQDFGLTMTYGPAEVRAQIKAVKDTGLSSWILWSASNRYTKGALEK